MTLAPGTYRLGPQDGTLWVRTGRTGAVAKAGHDLLIHVTQWDATLEIGKDGAPSNASLSADATSLRVQEGTGGMQALDEGDKDNIRQTIDDEILVRSDITFRSGDARLDGATIAIAGELTLAGASHAISFDLAADDDGRLTGSVVVTQTAWGMKPYSALFGALKVADDVEVGIDVALPAPG